MSDNSVAKTEKEFYTWKRKLVIVILALISAAMFIGYPLLDRYRYTHPVDQQCTVSSAELSKSSSGTGGISTSGTELKINTTDCGTVYVDYSITPKKSYQDMADELNQYQGQRVTLIFPPFQLPGTRDTVLTGYGYRL